jgi:hypothetical protein
VWSKLNVNPKTGDNDFPYLKGMSIVFLQVFINGPLSLLVCICSDGFDANLEGCDGSCPCCKLLNCMHLADKIRVTGEELLSRAKTRRVLFSLVVILTAVSSSSLDCSSTNF